MSDLDTALDLSERELIASRIFAAPVSALWRAISDPAILSRWWGPRGFRNTTHSFEFREGGVWRLTMHGPDGTDYPNEFIFRAIREERLIVLEHMSAPYFLATLILDAMDSKAKPGGETKATFRQIFDSARTCDALKSICLPANEDNLDRLAGVITS